MPTVCISIGHGSDTYERTGGKGVRHNGRVYEEHEANSDVAMRLVDILEVNGVETWLPQPPNSPEVPLSKRTDAANRRGVDLYWSIHFNAGVKSARGACAFYWHTADDSRKLAERYAVNMHSAGLNTHGDGTHACVPGTWTNFHECRETNMTAVLTENGFMTNPKDFELIFGSKKGWYRQKLAEAHAQTILWHFGLKYEPVKVIDNEEKTKGVTTKGEVQLLLTNGDSGQNVVELQKDLIEAGYGEYLEPWGADGKFGDATEEAVRRFQADHGLLVDGKAGVNTLGKLQAVLSNTAIFTLDGKTYQIKEID